MTSNLKTSYGNYIERNCTVSITLDKRTSRKDVKVYPLSVRFTISRKRWYHHVGGSYSEKDFSEICNVQTSRSPKFEIKRQWISILGEYSDMLARLNVGHELSLELIRNAITGNGLVSNVNFLTVWQEVIDNLKKEDRYGTAESYQCGLNSFKKILGEDNIKGFKIDKELLSEWNEGMLNGVKRGRKRIGKISDTTRGIYDKGADAGATYKNDEQQIEFFERIFVFLYSKNEYYDHRRHTKIDRPGRVRHIGTQEKHRRAERCNAYGMCFS